MNVGELLDYLATQPRDRLVILAKDAEGNGFSPLAEAGEAMYAAETTWSGQVYVIPELIAESGSVYTHEDAAPDDAKRVVVPTRSTRWPGRRGGRGSRTVTCPARSGR